MDADAARDVDEEDPPERGELPRLERLIGRHTLLDVRDLARAVLEDRRLQIERRRTHDEHVGAAEDQEVVDEADRRCQVLHDRTGDQCCKAEAHDGEARRKAAVIWEVFDECRDRRDVADTETDAADDAVEEIQERETLCRDGVSRAEHARAEERHGDQAALLRADLLDEATEEAGGKAEEQDGQREGPGRLGEREAHLLHDGARQDAPCIDTADRDVDPDGAQRDKPAISHLIYLQNCLGHPSAENQKRPSGTDALPRRSADHNVAGHVVNSTHPSALQGFFFVFTPSLYEPCNAASREKRHRKKIFYCCSF